MIPAFHAWHNPIIVVSSILVCILLDVSILEIGKVRAHRTLWIPFCRMSKDVDNLLMFYACDHQHAELKAEEILDLYGYKRLDLKEYPWGFRMAFTHLPGKVK
jgi:hypothetical protein